MGSKSLSGWWPGTLRSRLFLILFAGLAVAYGLSFSILFAERYMSAKAVMLGTLESDLATSIAVLDRLPANERPDWLDRLSRGSYRLVLGPGLPGVPDLSGRGAEIANRIGQAAGNRFPIRVEAIPGDHMRLQGHLTLSDGSPLTIDVTPRGVMPLAEWLPYVFAAQMALLILCTWFAVRLAKGTETATGTGRCPVLRQRLICCCGLFCVIRRLLSSAQQSRVRAGRCVPLWRSALPTALQCSGMRSAAKLTARPAGAPFKQLRRVRCRGALRALTACPARFGATEARTGPPAPGFATPAVACGEGLGGA